MGIESPGTGTGINNIIIVHPEQRKRQWLFSSWHSIPVDLLRSGQTSPAVLSCQCTILTPDFIRVAEKGRTGSTLYHAEITGKAGCNYHFAIWATVDNAAPVRKG